MPAATRRLQPPGWPRPGSRPGWCHDAAWPEPCFFAVQWAMQTYRFHPELYPGLGPGSSFKEFQLTLSRSGMGGCPPPCGVAEPTTPAPAPTLPVPLAPPAPTPSPWQTTSRPTAPTTAAAGGQGAAGASALSSGAVSCRVPARYDYGQLRELQRRNCDRVRRAIREFEATTNSGRVKADQSAVWQVQGQNAMRLCNRSQDLLAQDEVRGAADLAIDAWGTQILGGYQCCVLLSPPYCLDVGMAHSGLLPRSPVGILFLLCAALFLFSAARSIFLRAGAAVGSARAGSRPAAAQAAAAATAASATAAASAAAAAGAVAAGAVAGGRAAASAPLGLGLADRWRLGSSLCALPGAEGLLGAAAALFEGLQRKFDFQADSVRNQFDHFLSLWRSHVAILADRELGAGRPVDEGPLLAEALGEFHGELLLGFTRWRSALCDHLESTRADPALLPGRESGAVELEDAAWQVRADEVPAGGADVHLLSRQLSELAVYLLVWGEAGNLRFMPELLYLLTELALAAQAPRQGEGLFGGAPGASAAAPGEAAEASAVFLCRVVRPIYRVVFDEWYEAVAVDPADWRQERKVIHRGFERFLPPDVANYDDWNELFCDAPRLTERLTLVDGSRLFEQPHHRRFLALARVDWAGSLHAAEAKTFRELHSPWGVFAATHRVWFLHAVLFACGLVLVVGDPPATLADNPLLGRGLPVRLAAVGLLVPLHALLLSYARWETLSGAALRRSCGARRCLVSAVWALLWALPLGSYVAVRWLERSRVLALALGAHFMVSALGVLRLLFAPGTGIDRLWPLTKVPSHLHGLRFCFWLVVLLTKWLLGLVNLRAVYRTTVAFELVLPGREGWTEVRQAWTSASWSAGVLEWLLLWFTSFFLFVADTQLWFTLGCTVLGAGAMLAQRGCRAFDYAFEDSVSLIPERFSGTILYYAKRTDERTAGSPFASVWNRIVEHMVDEDKCNARDESEFAFSSASAPSLFSRKGAMTMAFDHYCLCADQHWPDNRDMQWRLRALSRGLALPVPRPFQAPYVPGLTVLIPHYAEAILLSKAELYSGNEETIPLMDWLRTRYRDEFHRLVVRMGGKAHGWPLASSSWDNFSDGHWEHLSLWASMRQQTLWRTVAGMCLYHEALQCHYDLQRNPHSALAAPGVWDPGECFQCVVSMQLYRSFDAGKLAQTNQMFDAFPASLQVAYIDYEPRGERGDEDGVHPRQGRRYYGCIIDRGCPQLPDGRRRPKLRVELPGFAIMGDGKADNQNNAIPFMHGMFCQCIDANQGAYFEQMLFLPCVLGEFRTVRPGDGGGQRIVGLPEHITSDFGSIGDFAAGSEVAFGSILQRSYAVLGARMHYGHPDVMNKQFMMQQGGVSKATKTLNLSEDIFAGMDFTLRGAGRTICHREYFHLAKGRDLGFNAVLGFFSKLSSGTGEQLLSRQTFRLGQVLPLPEFLSFYYAHAGFYITQAVVAWSMPVMVFMWLLALTADCEARFHAFMSCPEVSVAEVMSETLSTWFSVLILLFFLAAAAPLFVEVWMQRSFKIAVKRIGQQLLTGSFMLFTFQAKVVGYYVVNEFRYGGAKYVATGRGLPTERRPFIGEPAASGYRVAKVGGLYLDWALHTYYDAVRLLCGSFLVILVGGARHRGLGPAWCCLALTIASWLYAPFLFNPYQFQKEYVRKDFRAWCGFFGHDGGQRWVEWYDEAQLTPLRGIRKFILDPSFLVAFFGVAVWFARVHQKLDNLASIYSAYVQTPLLHVIALLPPVGLSGLYCLLLTAAERSAQLCGGGRAAREAQASAADGALGGCSSASSDSAEEPRPKRRWRRAAWGDAARGGRCLPLAGSAAAVALLEGVEVFVPLYLGLWRPGWFLAFTSALILKALLLELLLGLGEATLRTQCLNRRGARPREARTWGQPLQLWVRANRMARDLITSAFIFGTLAPLCLLNSLNDVLCIYNLHQLLVYRDPRQLRRRRPGDESASESESASENDSASDAASMSAAAGTCREDSAIPMLPPTGTLTSRGAPGAPARARARGYASV